MYKKIVTVGAWSTVFLLSLPLAVILSSVLIPNDFDVYWEAARALTIGDSPYLTPIKITVSEHETADCYYLYPPFLASIFRVLLPLERDTARTVWNTLNLIAIMITAAAGCYAKLWSRSFAPLAAGILFALPCSLDAFSTGQVDCIVLACYGLLLAAVVQGNNLLAGGALATAIHLKASPVLLLIPLLNSRNKRPFYYTILFAICIFAAISAAHGLGIWEAFIDSSRLVGAGERSWNTPSNRTPAKLLLTFLPNEISILRANSALFILSACMLGILTKERGAQGESNSIRSLGIGITVATIVSPIVWYHHFLWLSLPFCTAWRFNKSSPSRAILLVSALALAFSLILDATAVIQSPHAINLNAAWSGVLVVTGSLLCWLLRRTHQ